MFSPKLRKKWKQSNYREPYFQNLSMIFWVVNASIVLIHFFLGVWMYVSYFAVASDVVKMTMFFPLLSLFTVVTMAYLYFQPQYSNAPYSLLLEELPPKRQIQIRYIFQQLIVTSAGYVAVFFLSVHIHSVAVFWGVETTLFPLLYAFLAVLVVMKFVFASWFIVVTREKRLTKRA